jgi:Transposase zinc-ribbon domain
MTDRPEPGRDYPRDWEEFRRFFPDEAACVRYLEKLSWPHGFVCPGCGTAAPPWRGSRRRLLCRFCGHQTSLTAGTVFDGTRTPLRTWLLAAWRVAAAEEGVSARRLQLDLGLGSYQTAWTMLHRYRRAMVRSGRPRLEGVVEVDAVGLPVQPLGATVALAVEDRGAEPGRVRLQRLAGSAEQQLAGFLLRTVEEGAEVRLAVSAAGWAPEGYRLEPGADLRHLAGVAERLRRWLRGTHQGAASAAQLDWYLDEFTFRWNRRSSTHRGLLFYRLLEEAVVTPPQPYRAVAGRG